MVKERLYDCYAENGEPCEETQCYYLMVYRREGIEAFIDACNDTYCKGLREYDSNRVFVLDRPRVFQFDEDDGCWKIIKEGLIAVVKYKFPR